MTIASPTVRRLRLGIELRRLRHRAGRTMPEAADHVARTDSAISRIETGQVAVSLRVLDKLLDLYGATADERGPLRALAKEGRRRGWWHAYGDAVPAGFDAYLGLEAEASAIWIYEPEIVPDLAQTAGYARALMKAEPAGDARLDDRLAVRLRRQELLRHEGRTRAVTIVVHEAALRHRIGTTIVMDEQLSRLAAADHGPVSVRVLPFGAGARPGMRGGGFTLLSVPLGGGLNYDVTYIEYRSGCLLLDKPAEVDAHRTAFERLRAGALDLEGSRTLIARTRRAAMVRAAATGASEGR